MSLSKRIAMRAGVAVAGALMLVTGMEVPASAAARDGHCNAGEFCYYNQSGLIGSLSDFGGSVADYGTSQPTCYEFKSPGAGQFECVKNNAASATNNSSHTVRVYYNSYYGGTYQDIPPHTSVQRLNAALYYENASHKFL